MDMAALDVIVFVGFAIFGILLLIAKRWQTQRSLAYRQRTARAELKLTDKYLEDLESVVTEDDVDDIEEKRRRGQN